MSERHEGEEAKEGKWMKWETERACKGNLDKRGERKRKRKGREGKGTVCRQRRGKRQTEMEESRMKGREMEGYTKGKGQERIGDKSRKTAEGKGE